MKQSRSVLSLPNNSYICTVIRQRRTTDILVKVFSHYPSEEIWQFLKRERINDSTIHLYSLACSTLAIQVWGLFQFIFSLGFARTSSEIDGKSSTLSLYYSSLLEFGDTKLTTMKSVIT